VAVLVCYLKVVVSIQRSRDVSQNEVGVVTEVSTFLDITQVSNGLKKLHILIFSKYKYLNVKIPSLANVKSCVTVGPIR